MPYRIKIDRSLCTGYAECVGLAPEVFQLGPVDAITLIDEFEDQVWPR
jgi:ferredoxin